MPQLTNHYHELSPWWLRKVVVSGLSKQTTNSDLVQVFKRFGRIIDAHVVCSPVTGKSRGFGFVLYHSTTPVQRLLNRQWPLLVNGLVVEINQYDLAKEDYYIGESLVDPEPVVKLPVKEEEIIDLTDSFSAFPVNSHIQDFKDINFFSYSNHRNDLQGLQI